MSTPDVSNRTSRSLNTSVSDGSPEVRSIWRRIRKDVLVLGAGTVGVVIAQLVFRSILVTAMVPAAYGRLSLILSIYNTIWIIGASGLPSSIARYIAAIAPADDHAIIRSAIRASVWPIFVATAIVAVMSGVILKSPLACLFASIGIVSLVYSLLTMGILRGRGRMGSAASILPIAAIGEVAPLAIVWTSGFIITPLFAFGIFCFGNVIGLIAGIAFTIKTTPSRATNSGTVGKAAPSSRQLLGFSLWLGAATIGVAILPLVIRWAAVLDSYTTVALIDVSIVLLSIPQRVGTVILFAVIPHATRELSDDQTTLTISRRENLMMVVPFTFIAIIIAFTPIVGWLFDILGRPVYAKSADYLALALLAGPARILYGVVEGVLIAHGQGRLLARNALSTAAVASAIIVTATILGNTVLAFAVFAAAFWAIYLLGLAQVNRLARASRRVDLELAPSLANSSSYQ